jgi:uncharacterized protein
LAGRPLTQLLIKPAGADCNLRCAYCFYLDKVGLYPDRPIHRMPNDVLREMVRQMMGGRHPQLGFSWQGGEPTLCGLDFFKAAVEYQKQFGVMGQTVANSLQTNGILIDAEWCRLFHDYHFLIGLSLDGPPDIHNHYRRTAGGQGSHEYAMRAARLMTEHEVEFNILSVVNNVSAANARRVYRYLVNQGFRYLQFIPCVERDPVTEAPAPFSVSPQAFGDFLCELFDEWVKDFKDGWPTVSERTFDSLMHTYIGEVAPMCIFMESCGDYVVVEHNGDVYSCDFFVEPECFLGNLLERDLAICAASQRQYEFGEHKRCLPPGCAECPWLIHCNGGCLKDRYMIPATGGHDYFCAAYKQLFAHSESVFIELRDHYLSRMRPPVPEARSSRQTYVAHIPNDARPPAAAAKVGRNDLCPCGSGKKFKKCCGKTQPANP